MSATVFLPYRAEFGFIVMAHSPQVYAVDGPKVVFIEYGLEALYPGCRYIYVERREDRLRRAGVENKFTRKIRREWEKVLVKEYGRVDWVLPDYRAPRKYFVPEPFEEVVGLPSEIDLVICPRRRAYGADKNWAHWSDLVKRLKDAGFRVFAAGHPATSFCELDCPTAWGPEIPTDRYLDVTIEAMKRAKAVIATDNGLAHLAVVCGKPLILISHGEGLVADGVDDVGKPYWPIKLKEYYFRENHLNVPIHVVHHAWYSCEPVVSAAVRLLPRFKTV